MLDRPPGTRDEASTDNRPGVANVLSYIIWGLIILACFYLGARLTYQIRQKKQSTLHLNFDEAKTREKNRRGN
jgi:hypothetical protein